MEYKKIEKNNYNIHLINDKRFHTIILRVYFTENVTYEKITYRNFLVDMLTYASKNYDTKSKLLKKCQEIYSMYPTSISNRLGNLLTTKFTLCTLNSLYIDKSYLKENILLLKEIILNPLVENNKFKKEYFETIKNSQISEVMSQREDPRLYTNLKLLEILEPDKNKNYALNGFSDLEIINDLDEEKLYNSYLDMLRNSKIDIFVSGNITDEEEIIDTIVNNYNFKNNNYKLASPFIIHHNKSKNINYAKEVMPNNQSKLSLGIKAYDLNEFETKYVLPILSIMLGGKTDSLLMQEVREKNSLAYYANCFYNKLDCTIIINSGINKDNYDRVIALMKEVLLKILNGKFTVSYLKQSIHEYENEILSLKESNSSLIEYKYGIEVFASEPIEKRIEVIKKIKKEDIMNLAKKLEISAIFFLEGDL